MSLLYLCQSFCLRSVCLGGKAGEKWRQSLNWWLCFQPQHLWAASCWSWIAAAWKWLWCCRAIPHPHGSRGVSLLQSGSGSGSCPGAPGLFFWPHGSCPGSAGAQSPCHQLSVAAFQARKGRSGPGSGLPKHSQQTCEKGSLHWFPAR